MAGVSSFGLSRQILLRVLRATLRPCAAHRPRPHLLLRRRESSPGALRLDCARRHQLHRTTHTHMYTSIRHHVSLWLQCTATRQR